MQTEAEPTNNGKMVWNFGKILMLLMMKLTITDWDEIHVRNLKCSIDTRLRCFCFKIFHKAIAFNDCLFEIDRKNSPNCDKFPDSIIHIFYMWMWFCKTYLGRAG